MPRRRQLPRNEELLHRVFQIVRRASGAAAGDGLQALLHHGKSHPLHTVDDGHHLRAAVGIPMHQLVWHTVTDLAQCRKHAGCCRRQVGQIVVIDALDPASIIACPRPSLRLTLSCHLAVRIDETGKPGRPDASGLLGLSRELEARRPGSTPNLLGGEGPGRRIAELLLLPVPSAGAWWRRCWLSVVGAGSSRPVRAALRPGACVRAAAGGQHERRGKSAKSKLCIHR